MRCLSLKSRVWCGLLAAVSLISFPCVLCSQETTASLPRPFTWRLSPANLTLPGISPADFKTNVRIGGEQWNYFANVRITEALPGKPQTWIIVKGYKPGTWGTYSPGRITYSTWGPSLAAFAKMTAIEKAQHVRALAHHEIGHALGCPSWCQSPTQQRAYLVKKWGPPQVKGMVPEEIQPLPPEPRWRLRDRGPLRRLIHRLSAA